MAELTGNRIYKSKWDELDKQFFAFRDIYQDVSDFLLPAYGQYMDKGRPYEAKNVKRFQNILNDAGSRANQILGAGLQGGLCSPSREWFRLSLDDKELAKFGPVKEWLHTVEKILYRVYAKSNFYPEIHTSFEAQGGFGTAAIIQEEDLDDVVRFTMFQPGEYRLAMGKDGIADTLYRKRWMTAIQMVKTFGADKVSDSVKNAVEGNKTPFEYHQVLHCIEPNVGRDTTKIDNTQMPFKSVWIEDAAEDDKFLRQSGFEERPFVAPRWRKVGDLPYGLGPGCYVIGNVKMLQEMEKSGVKGMHKEVEPPLNVPAKLKDVLSLLPGAPNYYDGDQKVSSIYDVKIDWNAFEFKVQSIEARIDRSFFVDLFLMIIQSRRDVTATEIMERKEEKLILLGPTIERQIKDLFDPTITRTYNICFKRGLIPPPPEEIQNRQWEIEYISILAKAQKRDDGISLQAYRQEAEAVALLDKYSLAKTDWGEYLDQYAEIVGVPPKVVRTKDEADEIKQAMIDEDAQQAAAEQLAAASQSAHNLGSASTEEGTALGDMKEAVGA